jgi:hypothetical protein
MTMAQPDPIPPILDLTEPPPAADAAARLRRLKAPSDARMLLEILGGMERPRERVAKLAEVTRKLETRAVVELLGAAGRSSLGLEPAGLRVLFGFLEVKRPGVEVLRQLETLSSIRRVWLRILISRWTEPEESEEAGAFFAIMEALEEGARVGILGLDLRDLPRHPTAVRLVHGHLQGWFREMRAGLERDKRIPDAAIHFVTQLAMLEINLLEKRISRLASVIDPYDVAGMARVLPVLSRYDQDIEHMKSVVSRLTTYEPFYERFLTLEHALSTSEMEKIEAGLAREPATAGLERIVFLIRHSPILENQFQHFVSVVHRAGLLRAAATRTAPPDLHSSMIRVLSMSSDGAPLPLFLEPAMAPAVWPALKAWGCFQDAPGTFRIPYREDKNPDLVAPDGTPRLGEAADEDTAAPMSIRQLVGSQMQSDMFLMGILENPRAVNLPGVVELIAERCRSLRVLDKICRVRALHTGMANRNVPAALLCNPAPIPLQTLRRMIHVRFVSKVDLGRIARTPAGKRPEVVKEIKAYLATLRTDK